MKLVRDKLPEIIQKNGEKPIFRIAKKSEYKKLLREKLQEEVNEFFEGENPEELTDILEVVYALAVLLQVTEGRLNKMRKLKAIARGRFKKRVILLNGIR